MNRWELLRQSIQELIQKLEKLVEEENKQKNELVNNTNTNLVDEENTQL